MDFAEYLADLPMLHTWEDGRSSDTDGFEAPQLKMLHDFLRTELPASPTILETGAGNATIALTFLAPAQHIVICPDKGVVDRILSYCSAHGVSTRHVNFRIDISEWQLPRLAALTRDGGPPLDFALIDGGHNWPTVFVDFFYTNFMLRQGGYLMIDDLQLHSVKELGRMLIEEPGFEPALDLGKSLVFRKTSGERTLGDWNSSPYIRRISEENMLLANPFTLQRG